LEILFIYASRCPSEHPEERGFGNNKVKSHILRQSFDDATGNLKEARLATIF
jgi:hypothetical protein